MSPISTSSMRMYPLSLVRTILRPEKQIVKGGSGTPEGGGTGPGISSRVGANVDSGVSSGVGGPGVGPGVGRRLGPGVGRRVGSGVGSRVGGDNVGGDVSSPETGPPGHLSKSISFPKAPHPVPSRAQPLSHFCLDGE